MTGDQQFIVALFVQLVTLMGLFLAYRQSVQNGQVARAARDKVDELAISVNGNLEKLLQEKDTSSGLSSQVAHAEGVIEGRKQRQMRATDPGNPRAYQDPNV